MDLLSNSDVVIVLLKTNGERDRRPNFVILFFLFSFESSNCQRLGDGGLEQKVLFRAR